MESKDKSLSYYMKLDYDVIVSRVEIDGEFAYQARARELDPYAFYGTGDTKAEAIDSFEEVRAELFPYYLKNGIPIAEPVREDNEAPSGKFLIRTNPGTHKKLIDLAERNGQSLNAYINFILTAYTSTEALVKDASILLGQSVTLKLSQLQASWIQDTDVENFGRTYIEDQTPTKDQIQYAKAG